ncbi:hypothetical protein AB0M36_29020 [Actinoplanes sp. NPDC051346]|uniref:hypothetical protein n=1 Tax=Actinoplanes sp. NPDC051346 TaxID=3155048 RepID=UPI0034404CDB
MKIALDPYMLRTVPLLDLPSRVAGLGYHIGQGEVDWDLFFRTLHEVGFDGIATVCVFAWEERADDSCRHNLAQVNHYLQKYAVSAQVSAASWLGGG